MYSNYSNYSYIDYFLQKWKSVLRNAERQLIELLLTEAKVVSRAVEDKFERKLREMFTERSKVK